MRIGLNALTVADYAFRNSHTIGSPHEPFLSLTIEEEGAALRAERESHCALS